MNDADRQFLEDTFRAFSDIDEFSDEIVENLVRIEVARLRSITEEELRQFFAPRLRLRAAYRNLDVVLERLKRAWPVLSDEEKRDQICIEARKEPISPIERDTYLGSRQLPLGCAP